jgi:dipeptidyl aminopeptidase/acylaminoacyl peptidase
VDVAALKALLDLPLWVAFDLDSEGRVLAGSDELGSLQLVEIAPDGTVTPLTALPSRCVGRYVPGSRTVLVQHDDGGDEQWQISSLDLTELPTEPVGLGALTRVVADPAHMSPILDVTADSLVYSTNRRNDVDMDVVVRDVTTGEERVVFDRGGYVVTTHVSHDETSVAVVALTLQPNSTGVTLAGPRGNGPVTDHDELANHEVAGWAADDDALILVSDHDRDHQGIVRVSLAGPHGGLEWTTLVEADDHDLHCWPSRDGSLLLVGHHVDGQDRLAIHDADGHWVRDVDLPPVVPLTVVWAPDGNSLVLSATTPTDPGSILTIDVATGRATTLVDGRGTLPDDLRDRLVTPTVHRIPTPDGEQVPCFRYAGQGGPSLTGGSVLHIHGGPEGEAQQLFSAIIQALALSGVDVLVPNVRGSAGYGKRWYSLDDVELRLDSVADLAAIHAWLPEAGLDPTRSVLWGGSYGGYMVLAGVTMQPDLWAGGVDIVGISSLITFLENTSGYRRAYREREYGWLDKDREFLAKASPITHLDDLRAPLFVIHGANDPRVPLSEAEQIKAALDERGIECELKVYADEGHGLAKRANRMDAYPAAFDFLDRILAR